FHGESIASPGAIQHTGRFLENLKFGRRRLAELDDGLLHFVIAFLVTEEDSQVEPSFRVAVAEVYVLAILPFGGGGVFLLFGDASVNPVFTARVHGCDELRLFAGLIFAAADNSRR